MWQALLNSSAFVGNASIVGAGLEQLQIDIQNTIDVRCALLSSFCPLSCLRQLQNYKSQESTSTTIAIIVCALVGAYAIPQTIISGLGERNRSKAYQMLAQQLDADMARSANCALNDWLLGSA